MQRSKMLSGIGYGAAAFLSAVTVTSTNALAADVPSMGGRVAVSSEALKLLPTALVGKSAEKLQTLPSASLTTLVAGGRLADSTPITSFAGDPSALTPAASKLTKADLLSLSSGRLSVSTSSLTVADIASVKNAFRTGAVLKGSQAADGISSCCCTPCCTAATNDLSTFARA
jgi:hypothetical protein